MNSGVFCLGVGEHHMRSRRIAFFGFLACLALTATALGQYGHPLKGQWSGDWGPNAATRNRVLVDLNWDGKAVTGVIPPPRGAAITVTKATAEPVTPTYDAWTVHLEGP